MTEKIYSLNFRQSRTLDLPRQAKEGVEVSRGPRFAPQRSLRDKVLGWTSVIVTTLAVAGASACIIYSDACKQYVNKAVNYVSQEVSPGTRQ